MDVDKVICESQQVSEAVERIADAVINDFCQAGKTEEFALVGLFKQGVPLSCRIAEIIEKKCNIKVPLAALDISMYRDDFGLRSALPLINETVIPFDMDMTNIILVDDSVTDFQLVYVLEEGEFAVECTCFLAYVIQLTL